MANTREIIGVWVNVLNITMCLDFLIWRASYEYHLHFDIEHQNALHIVEWHYDQSGGIAFVLFRPCLYRWPGPFKW